ncbi:tetratricopeptide repeat protein [Vibrio tapetis]|uniref:Putative TPR domain protein, component of TonB system n=1 Tax=Vibrio tapetis subsp. tapetis TaxID=1671868 RepID=A0A2N8ZD01_9VIBR|nr:hypothetical protein [Vibrio tapetis]SON49772.1 putative TPR domain protein, component of TonB system [Vibrio tapetis subsp. tapetis]
MMKSIFAVLIAGCVSFSSVSMAQQLTRYNANKVQQAHELQQEDKIQQAIDILAQLEPTKEYDKAFVQRMLGVFYWQNGETNQAVKQLKAAVESGKLQDSQAWVTQKMLADILLSTESFKQALPHYYQLVKTRPESEPELQLWLRIVQAHYSLEQWSKVLTAMKSYERVQKQDDVQPLTIKLGAQMQLKQWKSALPTLQRLITLQPNKLAWWQQTAGIQLQLKQYKQSLATLSLAKRQGIKLPDQDLRTMAQLFAQQGVPEQAALVLAQVDSAKTDAKLLADQANYWQIAKEWQTATQYWALAAKSNNKYRWSLAQLLLQEGQYRQALVELEKVSGKKHPVELARVRAYYKLEEVEQALIHAKRAHALKASNESKGWIQYLSQLRTMEDTDQGIGHLTAR